MSAAAAMQCTVAPHALTRPPAPGRTNEPTPAESKKKPVKRSNSFSRRKSKGKGDEPGGGDADGYGGEADALQKPAFKLEEQKDPLREALQQEAADLFAQAEYDEAGEKSNPDPNPNPYPDPNPHPDPNPPPPPPPNPTPNRDQAGEKGYYLAEAANQAGEG